MREKRDIRIVAGEGGRMAAQVTTEATVRRMRLNEETGDLEEIDS